ncbi:MAG: hypothetical protein E7261_07495 [Lachnospiraceae bacterium]|nr:hypothetical protein [Lachnospiraceae bacterium]
MILFFIIGLAIIGLGIFAMVHSRKMAKLGKTYATVSSCVESSLQIMSASLPCYEVTFEIPTSYGVTYKTIKDEKSYNVGDTVEIFYDAEADKVELAKNVSPKDSKGPLLIIGFGAMICALIVASGMANRSPEFSDKFMLFFSYLIAIVFIIAGGYISVIQPTRRKKNMSDCHTVPGKIIDFRRERSDDSYVYRPIYGFYHDYQDMSIEGKVAGNGRKYRQIGRKVTIVINDVTDEIYCLEDSDDGKKMGFVFLVIGVLLLGFLVARDFGGYFGGSETGRDYGKNNVNSSVGAKLNLNSDGYALKAPDMPADEEFSEYFFMPHNESENYGYNIKIYHSGVGVVLIFPTESMSKGFQQTFAFYVDEDELETVVKDTKEYNFADFTIEKLNGADNHYLYYYDGDERVGSGGWGTGSRLYDSVTGHIKECVPDKVWDAIDREIKNYYK